MILHFTNSKEVENDGLKYFSSIKLYTNGKKNIKAFPRWVIPHVIGFKVKPVGMRNLKKTKTKTKTNKKQKQKQKQTNLIGLQQHFSRSEQNFQTKT